MSRFPRRLAIGAAALALLLFATAAPAQFRVDPNVLANQPALTTAGVVRPIGVPAPAFSPVFNPYWGGGGGWGGGWGGFYGMSPAYGALTGAANLTAARSQAQVTLQEARLLNEQALRSQLDTRKAIIEQQRWEYQTTPTLERQRETQREMAVRRSLNDPPLSEIASGSALNILLEQARRNQLAQVPGPNVPISPETLRHINVTTGTTAGGSQVARATVDLRWPLPLQAPRWKEDRDLINTAMTNATMEAMASGITFETNKQLTDGISQLNRQVEDSVAEMTPTEFIQARRFITQLRNNTKTLADPSAANYLTGKLTARGDNVAELVMNMQQSGLRFAAALPGDEGFYRSLHYLMASYVGSQAQLTAQVPPNPYQGQPQR